MRPLRNVFINSRDATQSASNCAVCSRNIVRQDAPAGHALLRGAAKQESATPFSRNDSREELFSDPIH